MTRQPDARQQELDFSRASQLAAIRDAVFPPGRGVSAMTLKAVLRTIDDYGRGRACWPSRATIADNSNCSVATVKRALRVLRELSVVTSQRSSDGVNGSRVTYVIVWSELELLRTGRPKGQPDPTQGSMSTDPRVNEYPSRETLLNAQEPPPPSAAENGWAEVAANLDQRGVDLAEKAVAKARSHGLSPAEAADIIAWFDAANAGCDVPAYGPPALYRRLATARPGQSPSRGWPRPSPEAVAARARQARERERRRQAEQRRRDAVAAVESEGDAAAVESEFGPRVDAMSPTEKLAVLKSASPLLADHFRRHGDGPLVRDALLSFVKEQVCDGRHDCRH